jgi:hypothetical protein
MVRSGAHNQLMPQVPAICDNCGAVFPSGMVVENARNIQMLGNTTWPCPSCGGMGRIPDGIYDAVGNTLRIVTSWSPEAREQLAEALTHARSAGDRAAAAEAINEAPGLRDVAARIAPRDPAQFWAFVACLLMLLQLLGVGGSDSSVTVNETTVIERVMEHPSPTVPPLTVPERHRGAARHPRQHEP